MEWLKSREVGKMLETACLMVSAYLFRHPDMTALHSLTLVTSHTGPYTGLLDNDILKQIIPLELLCMCRALNRSTATRAHGLDALEERRSRMRAEIGQLLMDGAKKGCSCGWERSRGEKHGMLQSKYGPVDLLGQPLTEALKEIEKISSENIEAKCHTGTFQGLLARGFSLR